MNELLDRLLQESQKQKAIIDALTPEEQRKLFADSLAELLSGTGYVLIAQNPWSSKLDIRVQRPEPISVTYDENSFSIHDNYGIHCNNVPMCIDSYNNELTFYVDTLDERRGKFIRTIKLLNMRQPDYSALESVFRVAYATQARQMFLFSKEIKQKV